MKNSNTLPEAIVDATRWIKASVSSVKRFEYLVNEGLIEPQVISLQFSSGWLRDLSDNEFLRMLKVVIGDSFENSALAYDLLSMWLHCQKELKGAIAEYAWQCLESNPEIKRNDYYDCDKIASYLAQYDKERAFELFGRLIKRPYHHRTWNPLEKHGKNNFWDVLYRIDRKRLIYLLLDQLKEDTPSVVRASTDLGVIDAKEDDDIILEYAKIGEIEARIVIRSITADNEGFWNVAKNILLFYPDNKDIKNDMTRSAISYTGAFFGSYAMIFYRRMEVVGKLKQEPKLPQNINRWLEDVFDKLKKIYETEISREVDEEVNNLLRPVPGEITPERIWAIKKVIDEGNYKILKNFLSKEDVLKILPMLDLSLEQENNLKKVINEWDHE